MVNLRKSDIHEVLDNYMHRHYFCRAGQFNIPTAENYKKLQTTGFFNRPYADIVAEYKAEQENINAEYTHITHRASNLVRLYADQK